MLHYTLHPAQNARLKPFLFGGALVNEKE